MLLRLQRKDKGFVTNGSFEGRTVSEIKNSPK